MNLKYTLDEVAAMMGLDAPEQEGNRPISGVSIDTRTLRPGDLFIALSGERHDGDGFVDEAFACGAAAAATTAKHASGPCLVTDSPLEALQRLASAHRSRMGARVIAITGSCGKTTTKDFIAALLGSAYPTVKTQGNYNNDKGCPLSLMRMEADTRFAVIEMGANHMGEIADLCRMARPDESAITMVAPAHLEGFGSIENVARAKAEILEALPSNGCFYVNMDDPHCRAAADRFSGEKVRFGHTGDVVLESVTFDEMGDMVLDIAPLGRLRLPLRVRAHAMNALLATAVGLRHGVAAFEEPLRKACRDAVRFKVRRIHEWTVLDDVYNANPASMRAALEALMDQPGTKKYAVLGSMFELGADAPRLHRELGEFAARQGIDGLLARGPNAVDMVVGARAAGLREAYVCESHETAAAMVRERAASGDVVLLKGSRGMQMEGVMALLEADAAVSREGGV